MVSTVPEHTQPPVSPSPPPAAILLAQSTFAKIPSEINFDSSGGIGGGGGGGETRSNGLRIFLFPY